MASRKCLPHKTRHTCSPFLFFNFLEMSVWNWCWKNEWMKVAQSCPTLWDLTDCSPPGSSVHGMLQARIPEWVAISFSRGSSQSRYWTQVSCIAGGFFTIWATREPPDRCYFLFKYLEGNTSEVNGAWSPLVCMLVVTV